MRALMDTHTDMETHEFIRGGANITISRKTDISQAEKLREIFYFKLVTIYFYK
jgi:hypothetical protein